MLRTASNSNRTGSPCPFCGQLHGTACNGVDQARPVAHDAQQRDWRNILDAARKAEVENVQLRKVLADALSAMRDWGAEEDGIPVDVGAWNAYCDGAMLLGWCIDPAYAVEGVNDE